MAQPKIKIKDLKTRAIKRKLRTKKEGKIKMMMSQVKIMGV